MQSGTTFACADANGKTADCHTAINGAPFGPAVPEIYYGGFANALAYTDWDKIRQRLLQLQHRFQSPVLQSLHQLLTQPALKSYQVKTIYKDLTGADGRARSVE